MPPVTNNHSASGYGKSYSGSYSTGRYDHGDSLSAGDYKSAYGTPSLSGSAGKLSCKNFTRWLRSFYVEPGSKLRAALVFPDISHDFHFIYFFVAFSVFSELYGRWYAERREHWLPFVLCGGVLLQDFASDPAADSRWLRVRRKQGSGGHRTGLSPSSTRRQYAPASSQRPRPGRLYGQLGGSADVGRCSGGGTSGRRLSGLLFARHDAADRRPSFASTITAGLSNNYSRFVPFSHSSRCSPFFVILGRESATL